MPAGLGAGTGGREPLGSPGGAQGALTAWCQGLLGLGVGPCRGLPSFPVDELSQSSCGSQDTGPPSPALLPGRDWGVGRRVGQAALRGLTGLFPPWQIIRVQSPDGVRRITATKRETAATFLKKVRAVWLPRCRILTVPFSVLFGGPWGSPGAQSAV